SEALRYRVSAVRAARSGSMSSSRSSTSRLHGPERLGDSDVDQPRTCTHCSTLLIRTLLDPAEAARGPARVLTTEVCGTGLAARAAAGRGARSGAHGPGTRELLLVGLLRFARCGRQLGLRQIALVPHRALGRRWGRRRRTRGCPA